MESSLNESSFTKSRKQAEDPDRARSKMILSLRVQGRRVMCLQRLTMLARRCALATLEAAAVIEGPYPPARTPGFRSQEGPRAQPNHGVTGISHDPSCCWSVYQSG